MRVSSNLRTAFFSQHPIEQPILKRQGKVDAALTGMHAFLAQARHIFRACKALLEHVSFPHFAVLLPGGTDALHHVAYQPVAGFQGVQPGGHREAHLPHGEFQQNALQHMLDVLQPHFLHIEQHHRHTVTVLQIFPQLKRLRCARGGGVEHNHKGFAHGLQLRDNPVFRLHIG